MLVNLYCDCEIEKKLTKPGFIKDNTAILTNFSYFCKCLRYFANYDRLSNIESISSSSDGGWLYAGVPDEAALAGDLS
jgi:hypothetical protein